MSETRDLSLGSKGERDWRSLRNAYLLGPEKGCSLLISDSGEVRSEVRRRMQSLAPATVRLEPARDVLAKIHEAAKLAEPDKPPLVWIEARDSADPQRAWADALQALNRGRDLVWDAGPVYVVLAGDSWMHRRLREGAPDLSSTINPVVMLAAHVELLGEPTEPLCWLHLSDVHVSSGDWQLDTVLEALIRDLPGLLAAAERKPQLLFVTGDIANRASPAEYDGAFDFFETLAKRVGIDSRHIFMVPGNHDVDRSAITKAVQRSEMMFDSLAEKNENEFRTAIGEIVGDPQEMRRYGARLAAWCQFTGRFLGVARQVSIDQPWRSDIVPVAGVLVGVASICSVWLSGPNERRGTLVVGELQVRQLVKELEAGGAQLRVALLHHPLDWLREADAKALRTLLRNEFDVVLHGHTHDPQAGAFVHGQRDTVEIGGGATYAGIGNDRFHGFSVGQLEPTASQGQVVIDAFTWTTRSGGHWHLDAGFHRDAPQGRMTLPLRLARLGAAAGAKGPPQPDALAGRLRRAALRVHAAQAFIGLPDSAPRPQASLHDMFVPLELRRRGPEPQAAVELATVQAAWLGGGAAPVRAVILGDPGSGKSTLCRYLVVSAAELEGGPVPILLTVRDWAVEGAREGILELALRHVERDLEIRTDLATLTAMCRAGRVLIAIDGVDETGPHERVQLRDRLHAFVGEYPQVGVIVTSRILGYDDAPLAAARFEHFVLEPFDESRLRDLIARWYAVAEPRNPSERQRRRAELWAALVAEPRAMALARNPLLATLIAMVHFHRAQLPGDRARLYALCIELMIVTWPAACGRRLAELEGFAQMPMLEELALGMQSQRPESEFGRPDARGVLITGAQFDLALADLIAKHRDELDAGRQRALADKWRRWLVRESGLIQEQQTDRFGFLHLSFLEYLAGQAALREQARMGHAAIARFVVERHGLPRWRETLLLMLGSRNDDRELGNAVVAELLAAERKWETGLFLLSLLREEIDIDPGLRTRVLEVAAESAIVQWSWAWGAARSRLADILRFGRKHGPPLRSWIEQGLASRRGEALVGLLVLLPETLEPTRAMIGRSDEDLGLAALLDLGPTERWGKWAIARATRATWWAWCRETPIAGIVHRAVVGFDHSEMWVASLLRRTAWISQVLRRAALELRGQAGGGGLGVPARIVWSEGSDRHAVVMPPAISTECEAAESRADFVRDFAGEFADGVVGNFEVDFEDALAPYLNENLARYFARYFAEDFARYFAEDFARYFAEGFAEGFANVKIQREPNHGSRNAPVDSSNHDWPSNTPADRILSPLVLAQAAEAYAGLLLTPSGEPAARIAEARVQNHWLNLFLDPLVNYITRSSPLTPEQHALFLALGLAQFQTTWSWPSGPHWKSWFASDPPEHWLTAYVWHLCWAVGEPANPEHQVRARACLDRGDSPELVDELRKFPLIATPPEVLALFDGSGGA